MKSRWFLLFLGKSLSRRKGRIIIASLSVAIAVAVITAMMGITSGVGEKLGSELKAYGANIIVSPAENNYIDNKTLNRLSKLDNVQSAFGQVYDSIYVGEQQIEVLGVDIDALKEKGWRISGSWPDEEHEILAGDNLRKSLNLDVGGKVSLSRGSLNDVRQAEFIISGFVETGGEEDSSFIMRVSDVWEFAGLHNKLSAVLVRSIPGELESAAEDIRTIMPDASISTVRQVAFAEESLLNKIQLLMVLVTFVVLLAALISTASTMGANVLERREEIGLMMALGARKNEISLFYVAEAVLIGVSGGVVGFLSGYLAAQLISQGAFDSYISVPFYTVFISVIAGLSITLLASHFPVRNAMKHSPAEILRGE